MLPSNLSSNLQRRLAGQDRLGLEGADSSLSPAVVESALGGIGNNLVARNTLQQQLGLRNSLLQQELVSRTANSDILAALLGRDCLREALLARHEPFLDPLSSLAAAAASSQHRYSLMEAVQQSLALAESAKHDAIVNEAFQRGKEEAMMSLLRSGAIGGGSALFSPQSSLLPPGPANTTRRPQKAAALLQSVSGEANAALDASDFTQRVKTASYFDASTLADPDPVTLANRRTRGGVTEPFPDKLHRMLVDAEENGEEDVVSWFGHGRAFAIHHVERFTREVMPRYFKQSRLSSFQRQLNLYGFTRISTGPDTGGYYHELFLKGRPALVIHMRRVGVPKSVQSTRSQRQLVPPATPDFYAMEPVKGGDDEAKDKAIG